MTRTLADSDSRALIAQWIEAMNSHETDTFLSCFTVDAVLDDPSVGERFDGLEAIADYFRRYFIGYDTTTRLVRVTPQGSALHVEVHFTGSFPGGQTGGLFDVTMTGEKISFVHADLS
jgi:ketosteroid isomerase-like protein